MLFRSKVIRVFVQGLIYNETEDFQGLAYKNRKRFGTNYASPKGKRIWQKAFSENASFRKDREADSGSRLSGLNIRTGRQISPVPERRGGRRWRSTARQGDRRVPMGSRCPSASVGGGLGRRRAPRRRRPLLWRTVVRVVVDLSEEGCRRQIETRVRLGSGP